MSNLQALLPVSLQLSLSTDRVKELNSKNSPPKLDSIFFYTEGIGAKIVTDLILLVFQTKSFIWPAENLFNNLLGLRIDIYKISKTTKNIILKETSRCFMLIYFLTDYQFSI